MGDMSEWPAWKVRLHAAVTAAKAAGKSGRRVCDEAGVSSSYLRALFKNPRQQARREELARVVKALDVSLYFIDTGKTTDPIGEEIWEILEQLPVQFQIDTRDFVKGKLAESRLMGLNKKQ